MNVCGSAYENVCGQWHVCYGRGLSIIHIVSTYIHMYKY